MELHSAIVIACLFTGSSYAFSDISRLEGKWTDPDSRGITSVQIRTVGDTVRVHVWGNCQPEDCDWGEAELQTYASGVDAKSKDTVDALSAEFPQGFANVHVVLYPSDANHLRVETFTVFVDSSGRWPYHAVRLLKRTQMQPASATELVEPTLLSPPRGSVFSVYPRTTTLQWSAVPGATKYGVEVDCYSCCKRDKWCADIGGPMRTAEVDSLTYTFDHVGAQPGRWRVWAIGPDGEIGPKSEWRDFRYTR